MEAYERKVRGAVNRKAALAVVDDLEGASGLVAGRPLHVRE